MPTLLVFVGWRCRASIGGLVALMACNAPPEPSANTGAEPAWSAARPQGPPPQQGPPPAHRPGPPSTGTLPPPVPRPDYMRNKPYLPDLLLKDKREGAYVTGFPAIGYDDNEGATLGAALQWFQNGSRDDPYFRSTAYRTRVVGAFAFTSNGVGRAAAGIDAPYMFDSPYRLRAAISAEVNPVARYFGIGESTLDPLSFPGEPGRNFYDFGNYQNELDKDRNGITWAKYDEWRSRTFTFATALERDYVGGIVRPLIGLTIRHVGVDDYTGQFVDATAPGGGTVSSVEQPTRLFADAMNGTASGIEGGWDNFLKLGVSLDTRNFEPDPSKGVLAQLSSEFSTFLLGSSFDYQRVTTSVSGYFSPFEVRRRLIFALRGLYSMQFGDVPFFSANTLAYNTSDQTGLGSFQALRGYKTNRFVGDSAAVASAEVRWYFTQFFVGTQHLSLGAVGFVDTGRVWDGVGFDLDGWKVSEGPGLALAWNLSTVIRFDYAISSEDRIFYMQLNHPF